MANRRALQPRFYADIFQYLKYVGYFSASGVSSTLTPNVGWQAYTMNPHKSQKVELSPVVSNFKFWATIGQDNYVNESSHGIVFDENLDEQLWAILSYLNNSEDEHHSSGAYSGVLGHNLRTLDIKNVLFDWKGEISDSTVVSRQTSWREIVNYSRNEGAYSENSSSPEYDGFSIWEVTGRDNLDIGVFTQLDSIFDRMDLNGSTSTFEPDSSGNYLLASIGGITHGIFFEPEFPISVDVVIDTEFDGVDVLKSSGGSSFVNVNHTGSPYWVRNDSKIVREAGDLEFATNFQSPSMPPWSVHKRIFNTLGGSASYIDRFYDYSKTFIQPRRSWEITFSNFEGDNLFSKSSNPNKFTYWNEGSSQYEFDTSMSSFFGLTLGGKIPFIFCPDSKADDLEFAICKIDGDLECKQVANNVFEYSLKIVEVW